MEWNYYNISLIPKSLFGVYAFWNPYNGKCIYVGKAKESSIRDRLKTHWKYSHNEELRLWIAAFHAKLDICYMTAEKADIDTLERRLIKMWKPETNKQHNKD